jgi:hypothetical protein
MENLEADGLIDGIDPIERETHPTRIEGRQQESNQEDWVLANRNLHIHSEFLPSPFDLLLITYHRSLITYSLLPLLPSGE